MPMYQQLSALLLVSVLWGKRYIVREWGSVLRDISRMNMFMWKDKEAERVYELNYCCLNEHWLRLDVCLFACAFIVFDM